MKYRLAFFLSCFIFLGQALGAQNIKVSGKVTDEKGEPLIGATIVSTDMGHGVKGAVADFDGGYVIEINPKGKLTFSYLGYISQEIAVNGQTEINVALLPDLESLDEVVVLGYTKTKKKNIISAVATVSGGDLLDTGLTNMSQAIQDRLPGVYTEIPSGQPGADDAQITIRGVSTFDDGDGANSPLILIDGIEATGGFSQLDPGEIASISVLKDAASTAVYGVRGANGVIIITTNRGREGAPKITVGAGVTAKVISDIPQKLSSYDVLTLGQEAIKNAGDYNNLRPQRYIDTFLDPNRNIYAYPDVDWYDALVKDIGWESNARVNVSGGTKFVKYFSALSINHIGDILKTEDFNGYYDPEFTYDKINFRTNLDFEISESTKLSVDISGRSDIRKTPDVETDRNEFSNLFKFLDQAPPYVFPTYYPAEFLNEFPDPLSPYPPSIRLASANAEGPSLNNPYTDLNYKGMRKFRRDVVDFQLNLNQKLDFITTGLSVSGKFNYSTAFLYRKVERYRPHLWLYDVIQGEWRTQSSQSYNSTNPLFHSTGGEDFREVKRNIYYEFKLDYQRSFGDHNIAATGVFNRRENEINVSSLAAYGEDWAGILSYNYNGKYLLKLTAAYNGTEAYAPGKRYGFFPGGSVGWDIAKEKFIKDNISWLNTLKVRYNYGEGGVSNSERFLYLGGYESIDQKFGYARFGFPFQDEIPRTIESEIPSPNATWETAIKQNLGFDIKLFDYELTLGIDLYKERREGILIRLPLPSYYQPSVGSGKDAYKVGAAKVNLGQAKNHGIEFQANYRHLTPGGLTYSVGGHFTLADSRIIYAGDEVTRPYYQKQEGKPIGWLKGLQSNGYINTFEEAINSPVFNSIKRFPGHYAYADFDGDGVIEGGSDGEDNIPLKGTNQPEVVYAFNGSLNYKGFNLSVRFFGKEGVSYASSNLLPNFNITLLEGKTVHLDRWSPENQNAAFPAFGYTAPSQGGYNSRSNVTTVESSYLKLQNVSLGYNLESEFLKKALKIQAMRFSLSGQNLYTWSSVPFGDPEGGNGLSGGFGQYPLVKRFIFGVNIDF
ncbi:TonB-dependent receptor [Flavivirga abyssicola]|uniref:SusC/RagA family TonB-linked outer membrane protein n=1 Tax=Flavivirga abyssicola TaxID=3063533 RepID=UPI0026DEE597|nr:TonB-dependent receptor [Flavivirga sp. MEBiC07777]WVK11661.1 TonB-dependent receptor [Flavivirga sp. MEBiC07777]